MIQLIPCPKQYEIQNEAWHALPLAVYTSEEAWMRHADVLAELMARVWGVIPDRKKQGGVELRRDPSLPSGHYTLTCEGAMVISASDAEGAVYGLSSAFQLLRVEKGALYAQTLSITDWAEKDYRAVMVDLSRCWHPFSKLLKYVDLCFLYKIKYLNLHFIDDVFYTLPSRAFPALPSEGRHYTFEQIEALRRYAADRGVILVPEIECPGHALPISTKYPEVFANRLDGEAATYRNEQGVAYDANALLCAGSETAFEGVKALLDEVAALFPEAPYINIGGDEVNAALWEKCPVCRDYMEKNGIADAEELYGEFIGRVCRYVLSLGKTPLVWEGFPKKGTHHVPREAIVIAWESHYQLAPDLLDAGFSLINASWQPLYIVTSLTRRWSPRDILNWNVYNWQHWWPHSAATEHPINVEPTDRVLGGMLCAWCTTYEMEIARVLENLPALAERTWSAAPARPIDEYRLAYRAHTDHFAAVIQDVE